MRRLLVLFALLGLLFSAVAAVAAQQTCAENGAMMPGMAMAAPDDGKAVAGAPDPCCDHGQKPDNKACAQACAAMCAAVGAPPTPVVFVPPQVKGYPLAEAALPLNPHPPPRTERPPRSIA